MVLHEPRLGFVKAEGRRLPDGRPEVLAGQILLVEAVAELVEGGEQTAREGVGVEAGGEAHVTGADADRRRMRRLVEPAAGEVEAEPLGDLTSHLGLETDVHRARQQPGRRAAPADRSIEERPDGGAQAGQHRLEGRPGEPRLPLVEQRVVAVPAASETIGLGLLEGHDAVEPRQERARVAVLAGRAPGLVRERGDASQVLDQRGGHQPGLLVLVAELAEIDGGRDRPAPGAARASPRPRRGDRPVAGRWPARAGAGPAGPAARRDDRRRPRACRRPRPTRGGSRTRRGASARGPGGSAPGTPRRWSSGQLWYQSARSMLGSRPC